MAAADRRAGAAVREGRVVIEAVAPEIDGGRFPIKRVAGEEVRVEADIFGEGHDSISCALLYRKCGAQGWTEVAMEPLPNDRWRASFAVPDLGCYQFTVLAWPDPFQTWSRDLVKRIEAEQEIGVDLLIGADLIDAVRAQASAPDADRLAGYASLLRGLDPGAARAAALELALSSLMAAHTSRAQATRYARELEVVVDRERAGFSSWYELFPRSTASEPGRHGTFRDVERWLPRLAELGFDVLYLPPIHPIGRTHRKGRNSALIGQAAEVGSPWAIGSREGGHKAVHPELGTLAEFRQLVQAAQEHGIEVALDIAFQAAPDHPYVHEHANWFKQRPDGTIQYAENPPKKYQDIYPFDFAAADAQALWQELLSIFTFWIDQGVRIFRVDNPHTKPFSFWAWAIRILKEKHPEVILLSEAFTRPKVMYRLAKLGFTQSYTYFAWRNTKWELTEYFRELSRPPVVDFFRPNLWPNTPDILTEPFHQQGEPIFTTRLILAATLSGNYGIYGPPYEKLVNTPREPGSEEYLDSEKYEIRHWDLGAPTAISTLIARLNRIRRANPALHGNRTLLFHRIDNEQILAYSKHSPDLRNVIITVVNLDPQSTQNGWLELPLAALGLPLDRPYHVHDLLTGARYAWQGPWNFVELNPQVQTAHVLRVEPDPERAHA